MKTEVKEKLHFKKYLVFLIGYFAFILIYFIYDIVTGVFSLKEIIDLIILLLALILFTIYTLKDFNLKKDKLLLNQKSSWLKVKIYNSLTWIFSFIAIIYLSFTCEKWF